MADETSNPFFTTAEEVGKIIDIPANFNLVPFLSAAHNLVLKCCIYPPGSEYDDSTLQEIETWLTAHFYTIYDNRPRSESAGSVSTSYDLNTALFLAASMYGQTAMTLDVKGGLAKLNSQMNRAASGKIMGPKLVDITSLSKIESARAILKP